MKKNYVLLTIALLLVGCKGTDETVKVIMPNGTPQLGLVNYMSNHINDCEVVEGQRPLAAAFNNKSCDIIVAPVNLGAKMYNTDKVYGLYETFVWGNLYVVSTEEITSFTDLKDKKVTLFGQNSTPDIIMKILTNHYDIDIEMDYLTAVSDANTALKQGRADIIVSAEPSLSKISQGYYVLDLQEEYAKAMSVSSYPQAGIFVKLDSVDTLKDTLLEMKSSIQDIIADPNVAANNAVQVSTSFATLGEETIKKSIPNCHFGFDENQKEAIETYFNKLNELNMQDNYGGKLPDEAFYVTI